MILRASELFESSDDGGLDPAIFMESWTGLQLDPAPSLEGGVRTLRCEVIDWRGVRT